MNQPSALPGEPVLAVADRSRRLLAAACADAYGEAAVLCLPETGARQRLRLRLRLRIDFDQPVGTPALHPELPLPAAGSGEYDGGCAVLLHRTDWQTLPARSTRRCAGTAEPPRPLRRARHCGGLRLPAGGRTAGCCSSSRRSAEPAHASSPPPPPNNPCCRAMSRTNTTPSTCPNASGSSPK